MARGYFIYASAQGQTFNLKVSLAMAKAIAKEMSRRVTEGVYVYDGRNRVVCWFSNLDEHAPILAGREVAR